MKAQSHLGIRNGYGFDVGDVDVPRRIGDVIEMHAKDGIWWGQIERFGLDVIHVRQWSRPDRPSGQ